MSKSKAQKSIKKCVAKLRRFTPEFKAEAVQMLFDGHTAASVCDRMGLSSPNVLYRWKQELLQEGSSMAVGLEACVRELEAELWRVGRERDILKKLSIFGRNG